MKARTLSLLLALATTCAASGAHAATSSRLTFQGLIKGGTCKLETTGANNVITLPTLTVADFEGGAAWRGVTPFNLTATCESDVSNVTFTFSGTPSTSDSYRFANTGTAGGLGLWLADSNGVTIRANGTNHQRTVTVSGNTAVLPLQAAYFKSGGAVAKGTFASAVTVNITYD